MPENAKYDAVFLYETDFQKNIITHIINTYYKDKKILVIDAINYPDNDSRLIINEYNYNINFNVSLIYFLKSFWNLLFFKVNIKTKKFFSSFSTGMNSKVWEQIIKYEELAMIDDGLGTVISLSSLNNSKNNSLIKRAYLFLKRIVGIPLSRDEKIESHLGIQMFAESFLLRLTGIKLKNHDTLLNALTYYYSIYNFKNITNKYRFKTVFLKDYYNLYSEKTIPNIIGFIGQELDSLGYQDFRISLFKEIYSKFKNDIFYYPHPREKKLDNIVLPSYVKIITKNVTIDEYFKQNGIPSTLITICSTTILNLVSADTKSKIFYLKDNNTKYNSAYKLFDAIGIESIPFEVENNQFRFIE